MSIRCLIIFGVIYIPYLPLGVIIFSKITLLLELDACCIIKLLANGLLIIDFGIRSHTLRPWFLQDFKRH